MDYLFVEPTNVNALSVKRGKLEFVFTPSYPVNFFESSLVIKIKYSTDTNDINLDQKAAPPSLNKFFIYNMIKEVSLLSNRIRIAKQEYVHDYVRTNYLFSGDPRDRFYGMKDIPLDRIVTSGELTFNIPIRFLFSEFQHQNHSDETSKILDITLQEIDCQVLSLYSNSVRFEYSISSIKMKVPQNLHNSESSVSKGIVWMNNSNEQNIEHIARASKGDIDCFQMVERPMFFCCALKDSFGNILDACKSVRLVINNEVYPKIDSDAENELDHYYEMYLRYIDYAYGVYSTEKHEKPMNVLSFEEYEKSPVFYFILPKLNEVGHYSVKLKLVLHKNNKVSSVYHRVNYVN